MPLIGFTVFKEKILDGSKTQTIRKHRKKPIEIFDTLYLYWHPRQKDCEKLGVAICQEEFTIRLNQQYAFGKQRIIIDRFEQSNADMNGWIQLWRPCTPQEMAEIINRDGFKDADEMLKFFIKHYALPEVFQVIRWNELISI